VIDSPLGDNEPVGEDARLGRTAVRAPERMDAGGVVLRAMTPQDWPLEQELSQDPDVTRWTFYPESMSPTGAQQRVRTSVELASTGELQRYVIWQGDDPVGTCGIAQLSEPAPEIMYVLLPRARGHGYATHAALAMAEWAEGVGYDAVRLETVEGNLASEHVAKRAGFVVSHSGVGDHRGAQATIHVWERRRGRPRL
jgi:RimJ/RimL family protein N-acetyltransferase